MDSRQEHWTADDSQHSRLVQWRAAVTQARDTGRASGTQPELAARAQLMDQVHQRSRVVERRLWQYAVTEVEDVAGARGGLLQNLLRALAECGGVGEQDGGVEVALD